MTSDTYETLSSLKTHPAFAGMTFTEEGLPLVWSVSYKCTKCGIGQDHHMPGYYQDVGCPLCKGKRERVGFDWIGPDDNALRNLWKDLAHRRMKELHTEGVEAAKEIYRQGRRLIRSEQFAEAERLLRAGIDAAKALDMGLDEEIGLLEDSRAEAKRKHKRFGSKAPAGGGESSKVLA